MLNIDKDDDSIFELGLYKQFAISEQAVKVIMHTARFSWWFALHCLEILASNLCYARVGRASCLQLRDAQLLPQVWG